MSGQCNQQHRASFPGDEAGVRAARVWLRGYIEGHSRRDEIALVAAELAGNAIRHTASGGDLFALSVEHEEAGTRLTVEDNDPTTASPSSVRPAGTPRRGTG